MADQPSRWLFVINLGLNLSTWFGVWFGIPHRAQLVPIHYTIYFGIDLTGAWTKYFWLPGAGLLALILPLFAIAVSSHPYWLRSWWLMILLIQILLVLSLLTAGLHLSQTS
ncbi:MAG: hypothetical protein HYY50_02510 [Candidatus Kerfeldbacteria bacterium]|nr:hypothetical protein [Candidatus Kerfeldbacteria bacterium]